MATKHGTTWPTKGDSISEEQYKSLKEYGSNKGVQILKSLKQYDGSPQTIKNAIDDIEKIVKSNPRFEKMTRSVILDISFNMSDDDYAETSGYKITLNANAFRNTDLLEIDYQKSVSEGWFVKGTTHRAIVKHEMGHIYERLMKEKGAPIKAITKMIETDDNNAIKTFLRENVSVYASTRKNEILPEVFSSVYDSNEDNKITLQIYQECNKIK